MSERRTALGALVAQENQAELAAADLHYRELNAEVRQAIAAGATLVRVRGVNGQRYLADGLRGQVRVEIEGVPGNDLAAFMDGPWVEVFGNAQDGIGNTMNAGRVVVHGDAGDVVGYGMRGGLILVQGNVGYRVGIHMKEYAGTPPAIVVGGRAGAFLAEYMAGGLILVLGLEGGDRPLVGDFCGTGMHGGLVVLRNRLDREHLSPHVHAAPATPDELRLIAPYLDEFCRAFRVPAARLQGDRYFVLRPASSRPYGNKYAL